MKLYTREQMIEAFNYGQKLEGFDWIGDMIDSLDAIELPSDMLCVNCDESKPTHNICMECMIKVGKQNIELPSDEEIEEKLNVAYGNGYEQGEMDFYKKMQCKGDKYADGYSEGYKRALDLVKYKIDNDLQGGNNEQQ